MATLAQIANASLQKILVQGAEAPLEPEDYQSYLFTLNSFMADLAANGISLGYTVVENLSDEITVPLGALRGIIYNMAVECAPEYGGVVSQQCQMIANAGMDTLRMIGQSVPTSRFPSTLPLGSGNYYNNVGMGGYFYPDEESTILGETTGSIGLESETTL